MSVNDQLDDKASIYDIEDELSQFFCRHNFAENDQGYIPATTAATPITDSNDQVVSVTINVLPGHEVFLLASFHVINDTGEGVAVGIDRVRTGLTSPVGDYEIIRDHSDTGGSAFTVFARDVDARGSETYYLTAKKITGYDAGEVIQASLTGMTFRTS